jgi:hypothetical protein
VAHAGSRFTVSRTTKAAAGVLAAVTALATAATAASAAPVHTNATGHIHIFRSTLTAAQIKAYSKNENKRVIVLLRNQYAGTLSGGNHALATRADTLTTSQRPLLSELRSLHAPHLTNYSFINAVSATVSAPEEARLKADPAVEAVVPDSKVAISPGADATTGTTASTATPSSTKAVKPATTPAVNTTAGICGTAKNPLLQPEALSKISAATTHDGITGKGVKIAVFPDGLDPNIKDYVRANGTHAIFDYRDFSGDGPDGVTGGGEAFGDASSIIAQGRQTFDLSQEVNPALPLPSPCDIRIKGVAPGASLAVMKVFGLGDAFDSTILQGLDWAVSHDHVNVLSESFGENPVPDPGTDPISVFDSEAVAHGIVVVASAGDAGVTNTIGGPAAASKGIISAAASTDFQSNAQLSEHGYQLGGYKGWESDNVSTFSSSGETEFGPNTVDVIAPGDSGWADCSTNTDVFEECYDSFGGGANPPPIEDFGGTSQACPLTAGVAALVIQAYKQAHGGHAPSAYLVKRIITSTATNLGIPADEQGAGQVNAKRAIALARSYKTPHADPKPSGNTLAIGTQKIEKTAAPGSTYAAHVTVTNEGGSSRTLSPVVQTFGPATTIVNNKTINYDPSSSSTPTYTYWLDGDPEPYAQQYFTVPKGYQQLTSRIGYPADQADPSQTVSEVLFDPSGKLAADSEPQGAPLGFSQVKVRNPEPGQWRAIYFSRPGSDKYSGPIATSVTVQKLVDVPHSVTPATATLHPGASKTFTVHYSTPSAPGDGVSGLNVAPSSGVVPILTRAMVQPTVSKPGTFSGEITAGNGRMPYPGQLLTYQFVVPKGVKDVDADVTIADPGYQVIGTLVDPKASPVDVQDTDFINLTTTDSDGYGPVTDDQTLHLSWQHPVPGRWTLDLGTVDGSSSGKTSSTISGTIAFNTVNVTSTGVPDSVATTLAAGKTATAKIKVTNTGNSPEIYYVDPRLAGHTLYQLGFLTDPDGVLPVGATGGDVAQAVVPPATRSLTMVAHATKPVNFTMSPYFGTPEITSTTSTTAVANYTAKDIPASEWACPPTLIGPFAAATTGGQYACAAFGLTRTIDDTVSTTGGNLWDNATDPNSPNVFDPAGSKVVQPGASTTLTVHITPTEYEEGETITGYLAVQTFDENTFSSDDLVHIPYTYTVGVPAS